MATASINPLLVKQMGMYTAYHRTKGNRLMHFVFVPSIVWSIMVLLSLVTVFTIDGLPITLAVLLSGGLLLYYLSLDFGFGLLMVLEFTVLLVLAAMVADLGTSTALWVFALVFVGSWIGQFLGHGIFEKRKPALFDNLLQVFIAPFFLVAETLFEFGIKPELKAAVHEESKKHDLPTKQGGEAKATA